MTLNKALMLLKVRRNYTTSLFESVRNVKGVVAGGLSTGPYDVVLFLESEEWNSLFTTVKNVKNLDGVDVTITLPVHNSQGFAPDNVLAVVLTRILRGDVDALSDRLFNSEEINFSASVAGPYDIILTVKSENNSIDEISNIVMDHIQNCEEVKDTLTLTTGGKFYFKNI